MYSISAVLYCATHCFEMGRAHIVLNESFYKTCLATHVSERSIKLHVRDRDDADSFQ